MSKEIFEEIEQEIIKSGANGKSSYFDIASSALTVYLARKSGGITDEEEQNLNNLRSRLSKGNNTEQEKPQFDNERRVPRSF